MASPYRIKNLVLGNAPNHTVIEGSLGITGAAGAIAAGSIQPSAGLLSPAGQGRLFSVVKNAGVGSYTVTLDEEYLAIVRAEAQVQRTVLTGAASVVRVGLYVPATRSIDLQVVDAAGAAANLPAGDRLGFHLVFTNSVSPR